MELKETNHLLSSVETNVVKPSEKNNSDKRSIYEMVFSAEEDDSCLLYTSDAADE